MSLSLLRQSYASTPPSVATDEDEGWKSHWEAVWFQAIDLSMKGQLKTPSSSTQIKTP